MTIHPEYAKFSNAPDCGWISGTAGTGPQVCGRTAKFTTDDDLAVNGKVCGIHARKAVRQGSRITPIEETA